MIKDALRQIKRQILYKGYAEPVHRFLKEINAIESPQIHKDGQFVVNLSFDLELALSTRFWKEEFHKSKPHGETGRKNLLPFVEYMTSEGIPYNVQIVASLLSEEALAKLPVNEAQKKFIEEHKSLFQLTNNEIESIQRSDAEIGLHAWSHRSFQEIGEADAKDELTKGQFYFEERFGRKAEFMSYPKNHVNHESVLRENSIKSWRIKSQESSEGTVPLGLWFAPGNLDEKRLRRLLKHLEATKKGYFLHLWGHFTEMDIETFRMLIQVIQECGWTFSTVKSHMNEYV